MRSSKVEARSFLSLEFRCAGYEELEDSTDIFFLMERIGEKI